MSLTGRKGAAVPEAMAERIDRDDSVPLYQQVRREILAAIGDGRLPVHAKLASERELTGIFGVSRITVRQAIQDLVQQGILKSQPGKGFFVSPEPPAGFELHLLKSFTATALAGGRTAGSRLLEARIYNAPVEITRPLFLGPGAEVILLRRLRLLDGEPVLVQSDWLPLSVAPTLLDLDWTVDNRSLYGELRGRFHVHPKGGQTTLGARLASAEEARLLELAEPAAVLTLDQIAFDDRNRPVNLSAFVQHPQRYPLTLSQSENGELEQY